MNHARVRSMESVIRFVADLDASKVSAIPARRFSASSQKINNDLVAVRSYSDLFASNCAELTVSGTLRSIVANETRVDPGRSQRVHREFLRAQHTRSSTTN